MYINIGLTFRVVALENQLRISCESAITRQSGKYALSVSRILRPWKYVVVVVVVGWWLMHRMVIGAGCRFRLGLGSNSIQGGVLV